MLPGNKNIYRKNKQTKENMNLNAQLFWWIYFSIDILTDYDK